MTKLISLVLAFGVGSTVAAALPTGDFLDKRQVSGKATRQAKAPKSAAFAGSPPDVIGQNNPKGSVGLVLAAQMTGRLSQFMGEPEASEYLGNHISHEIGH